MQRVLLAIFLVFMPLVAGAGGESVSQDSIFWPTSGVGDGSATGYSGDQWQWAMRMMWLATPTAQGVSAGYLNELAITNPAGVTLRVASGGAIVYGLPYRNTANVDFALTIPVIGTTGFRVVLRADWAAQTVRVVLLESADGVGAAPAVTQTAGVTWDITLATGTITTAPAVAVTDARAFFLDNGRIVNRTRHIFVPAVAAYNNSDSLDITRSSQQGWILPDLKDCWILGNLIVPLDYVSDMEITAIAISTAGTMWYTSHVAYGAIGEAYNIHNDQSGPGGSVMTAGVHNIATFPLTNGPVAVGDHLFFRFTRHADNVADTIGAPTAHTGWIVTYAADM